VGKGDAFGVSNGNGKGAADGNGDGKGAANAFGLGNGDGNGNGNGNAFGRTPNLYLLRMLCNLKLKNFKQRLFQ